MTDMDSVDFFTTNERAGQCAAAYPLRSGMTLSANSFSCS
jgi:hypothetical protein